MTFSHRALALQPTVFRRWCVEFAGEENWADEKFLKVYAGTLLPCVYEDYIEEAKKVIDSRLKEKLRKLLTYNLNPG